MSQHASKERGKVFIICLKLLSRLCKRQIVMHFLTTLFEHFFSNYAFENFFTKYPLKIIKTHWDYPFSMCVKILKKVRFYFGYRCCLSIRIFKIFGFLNFKKQTRIQAASAYIFLFLKNSTLVHTQNTFLLFKLLSNQKKTTTMTNYSIAMSYLSELFSDSSSSPCHLLY